MIFSPGLALVSLAFFSGRNSKHFFSLLASKHSRDQFSPLSLPSRFSIDRRLLISKHLALLEPRGSSLTALPLTELFTSTMLRTRQAAKAIRAVANARSFTTTSAVASVHTSKKVASTRNQSTAAA